MSSQARKMDTAAGPVEAWMQSWFGISPSQAREQANSGPVADLVRSYLKERDKAVHSDPSEDAHRTVDHKS